MRKFPSVPLGVETTSILRVFCCHSLFPAYECISNLVVFKHLKLVPRRDFSNQVFPEPFSESSRHANTAAHRVARAGLSEIQDNELNA